MNKRLHVLTLIVFFSANAVAQETVNIYEPANFPADKSSIIGRIQFPDYEKDIEVRVFCDVTVSESGDFGESVCRSDHEEKILFIKAVEKNIDITQISPAKLNGKEESVYFQYTVQFEQRGNTKSITLFPHQFVGVEGPGDDYIGPQRYHNRAVLRGLLTKCTGSFLIWYAMIVPAEGGRPTNVRALNNSDNAKCESFTRDVVEGGMYIPAFLRGEPVTAPYAEIWADRAWR